MKNSFSVFIDCLLLVNTIITLILSVIIDKIGVVFVISALLTLVVAIIIYKKVKDIFLKINRVISGYITGKKSDMKLISEYSDFDEFTRPINDILKLMKKNNFDLKREQSKTEIILEQMADGVIAFNISKDIIHTNKSAHRLLNLTDKIDDFDKLIKHININVEFNKVLYMSNTKRLENTTVIDGNYIELVFIPFYEDLLKPIGVILIVKDVTESIRLDNMRKEFVANVSHELKTPLTSIKGYSETMLRSNLTKEQTEDFTLVINKEANRMDKLVIDLLQLSKFDYNKHNLKIANFNLSDLAHDICRKMQMTAKQKEHKFISHIEEKIKIYADKGAIEQVITNIISNSIKYTVDGGTIEVTVGTKNDKAYVEVKDNGIGIPKKDLDRIFERFYRVDKARSRQMGGTGLGLSIVKEIVDLHEGEIDIQSIEEEGTTITIYLPLKGGD